MKKLLMFLCCVFMLGVAHAGCNSPVMLSYVGNQDPDDNEFLYESNTQFELAKQGYINTGHKTSGNGLGYECDEMFSGSCSHDDVVSMPSGHVFKGEVINRPAKYRCQASGAIDDRWIVVDDGYCDTKGFGKIVRGRCVEDGNHECRILTRTDCSGYKKSDENGTSFWGVCRETSQKGSEFICIAVKCDHGMEPDANGICKPSDNGGGQTGCKNQDVKKACLAKPGEANWNEKMCECTCKDVNKRWNGKACELKSQPTPSCRGSRTTNEGKACCDIQSAVYNAKENTCTCQNGEKFELYNTNHGRCVADSVVPPVTPEPEPKQDFECPEIVYGYAYWRSQYKDCPDVVSALDELQAYCAGKPSQDGYEARVHGLENLRDVCKDEADKKLRITKSTATINNASKKLDDIMSAKLSLWKTAEGNFNTARLASDSIAGVVLGTAGGLITSHLVKKGQVKNGFEDIQCTVGGQKVADWGDEFTVGIR